MSSVECLREFVNERLTAAAEEIFRVFKQTVVKYEEEIDRQRRLLDIIWKPEVKLHRIEVPQQHVCKEEEVLTDQLFNQEEPQPPEVKEEQEDLCTSQDGKQLVLEQETDTFMCTSSYKESDPNEDQTLYFKPDKTQCAAERDSAVNVPVITSVVSVPHVAKSPAQKGDKPSRSTRNAKPKTQHHKSTSHKNNVNKSTESKIQDNKSTGKKTFKCDTCGKVFKLKSKLSSHMTVHTGERPYSCDTCGKTFGNIYCLKTHLTIHTGEKPFLCKTCGKSFRFQYVLNRHMRVHTGERPYSCDTCGKTFGSIYCLKSHLTIHTGEKPFLCKTCGKSFRLKDLLSRHMKVHTGEKPYSCNVCGKSFSEKSDVNKHTRIHTEKLYTCKTCGRKFRTARNLTSHMTRAHTQEN